jgi:serine/threonine protein kinase
LLKSVRSDWRGFSVAVCDFGLSRLALMESETEKQKACGTLIYMAPERLNGSACKASDIYALGIILFQLVSSTEPFKDIPSGVIISGVKAGKLRPKWPRGVFPELQNLYERCVLVDPLKRPSASEIVKVLMTIEIQLRLGMMAADPSSDEQTKKKAAVLSAAMKKAQSKTETAFVISATHKGPLSAPSPTSASASPAVETDKQVNAPEI